MVYLSGNKINSQGLRLLQQLDKRMHTEYLLYYTYIQS